MLKTNKSININGTSIISGNVVATMNGSIPEDGNISVSTYIQNKELYDANKKEVQEDISAFNALIYEMEV